MGKEFHKPGEKAPDSGQYPVVGPRGGDRGTERTVTKGEPFPPTPKKGQGYGTPDKTKH
ncbi:YjzC family protein [Dehalogenimonas etheniformans]|nr:YjzC family protein [Dehalogenimonas etheniformans]QNT75804.1 YjzC family protein [Dehalogenimonas etheniformans]